MKTLCLERDWSNRAFSFSWRFCISRPWQHVAQGIILHSLHSLHLQVCSCSGSTLSSFEESMELQLPYAWYYHPLALRTCCNVIGIRPWLSHFEIWSHLEPLNIGKIEQKTWWSKRAFALIPSFAVHHHNSWETSQNLGISQHVKQISLSLIWQNLTLGKKNVHYDVYEGIFHF